MYTWFYGFSEEPFNVNPDPNFLFLSETHQQVLDFLIRGIQERAGFILVLGDLGSGKTTLIQHLLNILDKKVKAVAIFHPHDTLEELLEDTLRELGVPAVPHNKVSLVRQLNDYLHSLAPDETLALLIDEAQELSPEVMEELRLLPTPETLREGKLQIILAGQPELKAKLDSAGLRELRQKIEVVGQLRPLKEEECRRYIAHRLQKVDSEVSRVFTAEALDRICQHGKGNPRTINILCDNSFLVGYGLSKKKVDSAIVAEVLEDLDFIGSGGLAERKPEEERRAKTQAAPGQRDLFRKISYSLLALVGVGGLILVGRIYLKEPEEALMAKFPIQPPALQERGALPRDEAKPEKAAKADPQPEKTQQPPTSEPPAQAARRIPAEKTPPPGEEKKPTAPPAAEKKPAARAPSEEAKPASALPGKPEPAPLFAEKKPSPPSERTARLSKPEPAPPVPPPPGLRARVETQAKKTVPVKDGDSLYNFAAQNYRVANTSVVDQILEANPQIADPHKLPANLRVRLPEITEESLIIAAGDGTYQVRLGTFLKAEYSTFLKGEPALRGKPIEIVPRRLATGETWYRAVAGKFSTREEGVEVVRELRAKGLSPYFAGFKKKK
jgi:general secretion pathway protein A